jgi:PKHD-type hydroxylase
MTIHIEHRLDRFLEEEIEDIKKLGDALIWEEGKISGDKVDHTIRDTRIAWLHPTTETHWLFDRAIIIFASSLPFFSTLQSMQYTIYDSKGSHYDWHRDVGNGDEIMKARVNVGIVQLSSPSEYKGGVLQIKLEDGEIIDVMKTKGLTTTFPINLLHKVSPVTSGVRKTLIMWGLV